MKQFTITILTLVIAFAFTLAPTYAMPKGVDSFNYDSYVKENSDAYGYNIGECERDYLVGEEYFYNKDYDHWNVDKVYDSSVVTSKKLANAFAKANYSKCKVKFIGQIDTKKEWKMITHRKGKKIVYIEKVVSISSGKNYGYTKKGHYYIAYNKKVKKGKKVTSYCIWNPYTNYDDDVVAVVDNKMIRSDFSY